MTGLRDGAIVRRGFLMATVVVFGIGLGWALPTLASLPASKYVLILVYMVTIAVGEVWRVRIAENQEVAPLALAASLSFAFVWLTPDRVLHDDMGGLIVVGTGIASALGRWLRIGVIGAYTPWAVVGTRILVTGFAVLIYRVLHFGGNSMLEWTAAWAGQRWLVALALWAVALVAMAAHLTITSVERALITHARLWQTMVDGTVALGPVTLGVTSTAAVIPMAISALGPVAVPLFLVPLALLRLAMTRQASVRTAQRQTIYALSRLTEQGGFTPGGHATRVARLSVDIGRHLGLSQRELTDLEYAALLHDLGQVSLRRPIPGGATVQTSPLDQRRIAVAGASILARTAELSRLAPLVAEQATPYVRGSEIGHSDLASRIIRVANGFDDLVGLAGVDEPVVRALERIRLNTPGEYDPVVVRALCAVLLRDGRLPRDLRTRFLG